MSSARHLTPRSEQPLWRCPKCGREFANRNQSHTCGLRTLEEHLRGKADEIRSVFARFVEILEGFGPVCVLPEKTRIAFQVRMSFAQLTPRMKWVGGHLVLARRVESPRFWKVETYSPRNHLHAFRISATTELDDEFRAWMREAYAVGRQDHLR